MKLISQNEVEDIYMKFKQALTFDGIFTKEIVERLDPLVTMTLDESQNRMGFTCFFENYSIRGYLDSSKVLLKSERRDGQQCVIDFMEKVNEI